MSRFLKHSFWAIWLAAGVQTVSAFSLLGVREPYQVIQLGYIADFSFQPKNLGEEFRFNIPTLYYTYDSSFFDYFGSNGVYAVDQAVAILNNLTNVSSYSSDLSEFGQYASRVNYTASVLHLMDLKSCALEIMVERLGLADPELFSFTLRNRIPVTPPGCPVFVYTVIKRNFDPVTLETSSYVNGNLYSYRIIELCPTPDEAFTLPFLVDPDAILASAIATPKISVNIPTYFGFFHNGLTRDDVGGLRYMYRTNNVNQENACTGTLTFITNSTSQLLVTSNLNLFAAQALTNDAATLGGLYPNLNVISTTNTFTNVPVPNLIAYFTNFPYDPAGTPAHLILATNISYTVQTLFHHTFGNLLTFRLVNGQWVAVVTPDIETLTNHAFVTIQTVSVTNSP